jgi:Tfp pilus assembly protein PilF
MARKQDPAWEIGFFESVLRHDPHYVDVVAILGGLYTKTGRVADGLRMDRKMVRLCPEDATAHYNLACSLALSDRPAEALDTLGHAISLGYDDVEWMSHDPDLNKLHASPQFQELLELIRDA